MSSRPTLKRHDAIRVFSSALLALCWFFLYAAAPAEAAGERAEKPVRVKAEKIDHVTVCVKNLEETIKLYERFFETEFFRVKPVALGALGVRATALNAFGIELAEAGVGDGEAAKFQKRMGDALWGIAFKVPDLEEAIAAMQTHGLRLLAREDNATRKVAVFHPEDTFGVLLKLVEYTPSYAIGSLETVEQWKKSNPSRQAGAPSSEKPRLKVEKINHALLIVSDLSKATRFFMALFGSRFYDPGSRNFTADGLGFELIGNPASGLLKKNGAEGVFAFLSLKIADFEQALDLLGAGGGQVLQKRILSTRKVALVYPTPLGIGLELIEYRPLAHPIVGLEMEESLKSAK